MLLQGTINWRTVHYLQILTKGRFIHLLNCVYAMFLKNYPGSYRHSWFPNTTVNLHQHPFFCIFQRAIFNLLLMVLVLLCGATPSCHVTVNLPFIHTCTPPLSSFARVEGVQCNFLQPCGLHTRSHALIRVGLLKFSRISTPSLPSAHWFILNPSLFHQFFSSFTFRHSTLLFHLLLFCPAFSSFRHGMTGTVAKYFGMFFFYLFGYVIQEMCSSGWMGVRAM